MLKDEIEDRNIRNLQKKKLKLEIKTLKQKLKK